MPSKLKIKPRKRKVKVNPYTEEVGAFSTRGIFYCLDHIDIHAVTFPIYKDEKWDNVLQCSVCYKVLDTIVYKGDISGENYD